MRFLDVQKKALRIQSAPVKIQIVVRTTANLSPDTALHPAACLSCDDG